MIAMPPWKAEYLEKKRKKERKDEIPLWKRDLIKRIQSKNKTRMAEEDQKEIVEEHIPRVSDNIFLVHEKQQHRTTTLPNSLATSKVTHPEPLPSSAAPVSTIENVIIIEKDTDEKQIPAPANNDGEQIEYPKTGIVHRLMGRFQSANGIKTASPYHVPPYQRSQSVEAIDIASEQGDVPCSGTSSHASDIHPRTYSMPNDVMTPLLLSSAKPFIKQSGQPQFIHISPHSNTGEKNIPGYHHVTIPKQKHFTNNPTSTQLTNHESATVKNEKVVEKTKISDEMSSLHGIKSTTDEPTNCFIHRSDPSLPKPVPPAKTDMKALVNGDSLHSSGHVSNNVTANLIGHGTRLQDKSNFPLYGSTIKNVSASEKKEVTYVELNKTIEIKSKPQDSVSVQSQASDAKENINQFPRTTKSPGFKIGVVNETMDESTLKTPVPKTVNITPKKVGMRNNIHQKQVTTSAKTSESSRKPTCATEKPLYSKSHDEHDRYYKKDVPIAANQLPSTCIDDVINENVVNSAPIVITAVDSLPVSTVVNAKTYHKTAETKILKPTSPVVTNKPSFNSAKQNFVSKKPTSPLLQKNSVTSPILQPNLHSSTESAPGSKKGFKKSFVIDPSKFKRSSAARPTSSSPTTPGNKLISVPRNGTQVTPQLKKDKSTDQEDTVSGEAPKGGKRKLTVDQITVIGGYVSLDRSCLVKNNKRKMKGAVISFCAEHLEKTYTYTSERSLLMEDTVIPAANPLTKGPGFGKESSIGKYTPKYLLSMKDKILDDDETEEKSATTSPTLPDKVESNDATPLSEEAPSWSQTTDSTDILF